MQSQTEIISHTSLRGIAALLVISHHYRFALKPAIDIDLYTSFFHKGYVWVDLFFILSGFILSYVYGLTAGYSKDMALDFLRARFARVYPLHLATLVFLLVAKLAVGGTIDWNSFVLNVLVIHAWGFTSGYDWNFPSWSISIEFAAYVLFIPYCFGLRFFPRAVYAIASLIISVWAYYFVVLGTSIGWILSCLPMFFLGTILYKFRSVALALDDGVISGIQAISLVAILYILHFGFQSGILVLPFMTLVFSTQTDRGILGMLLATNVAKHLGDISYSIYMLHIPVLYVISFVWQDAAGQFGSILFTATAFLTTLIAGHLSFIYFESPIRRLIGKRRLTVKFVA